MKAILPLFSFLLATYFAPIAKAVDTAEPFESGFSNIEAYYSNTGGSDHLLSSTIGMGVNAYLNPGVSLELDPRSGAKGVGLGLQNLSQLGSGVVDLDLITGWAFSHDSSSLSLGTEVTYPVSRWTPFIQLTQSFEFSSQKMLSGLSYKNPSFEWALGVSRLFSENTEALFRYSQSETLGQSTRGTAVGLNHALGSVELILEIFGEWQKGTPSSHGGSVGMILTLEGESESLPPIAHAQ